MRAFEEWWAEVSREFVKGFPSEEKARALALLAWSACEGISAEALSEAERWVKIYAQRLKESKHSRDKRARLTCTRRLEWDAAHRIKGHPKCGHIHGHRYAAEITCNAETLEGGMVVDFGVIKDKVGGWIDRWWDHNTILHSEDPLELPEGGQDGPFRLQYPPTAESLATHLANMAAELLAPDRITVERVRIWETPNCSAEWKR